MGREQHTWSPVCAPPGALVRPARLAPGDPAGPTRGAARRGRWRQTSWGYHVPAYVDGSVPEQRILEQSMRLPAGGAVTGWAGCRMAGAAFFDGVRPDGRTLMPVPLVIGARNIRGSGSVDVFRDRIHPDEVMVRHGVPCAREPRSLFDAMRRARDVREAVVSMDMMAAAGLVSIRRMADYRDAHSGWRGARLVAQALALASEHSRSPNETRLRLIWTLDAGLPPPLVNAPVFDLSGRLLGIPDLLDVEAGLVGEFDGADHRKASRHSKDLAREDGFRRHGLEFFRVSGLDLPERSRVVARIVEARRRALWEPVARRRWSVIPPAWSEDGLSLDEMLDLRDIRRQMYLDAEDERWQQAQSSRKASGSAAWRRFP